jgi:hypothetical protein
MSHPIAVVSISRRITSTHPARTFVIKSLRLMTVIDEKMKKQNTNNISKITVMNGLISLSSSTKLSTSGADQAQKANASDRKIAMNTMVIIEDLIISLLSGISSLKVNNTDLNVVRIFSSLLKLSGKASMYYCPFSSRDIEGTS